MMCPECQHYMREYLENYRCIYCGKNLSKCEFNVSSKPTNLSPRVRRKPINISGLFWLLYMLSLITGLAIFLFWLQKPYYSIFIGGI